MTLLSISTVCRLMREGQVQIAHDRHMVLPCLTIS
jgi:hypothetical protein